MLSVHLTLPRPPVVVLQRARSQQAARVRLRHCMSLRLQGVEFYTACRAFHAHWRPSGRPNSGLAAVSSLTSAQVQASGVKGDSYYVSETDIKLFKQQGYLHLPSVMSDSELSQELDEVYEAFMAGKIEVPGKDLCDMSGNQAGRTPEQFTLYNVMLPRIYYPALQGNSYERRCKAIADQLQGGSMQIDYDQILAKRPHSEDAIFAWHQDMAYWPPFTSDISAATCWLALTDSTEENGCMRFVPGSHKEPQLRKHAPVGATREDSHALYLNLQDDDTVKSVPIKRGDITVHNERVAHGSGPNISAGWRKAYVLAFRKAECITEERSLGFTHSHNDENSWDVFNQHSK